MDDLANVEQSQELKDFVAHITEVKTKHFQDRGFATSFTMEPKTLGKWVRIDHKEPHSNYAYAFVALVDNETKALGKVKAGDIHKPASYKQPAKHARGSIYDPKTWTCVLPFGLQYLR